MVIVIQNKVICPPTGGWWWAKIKNKKERECEAWKIIVVDVAEQTSNTIKYDIPQYYTFEIQYGRLKEREE